MASLPIQGEGRGEGMYGHRPVGSMSLDSANPRRPVCGALADAVAVGRQLREAEIVPLSDVVQHHPRDAVHLSEVDAPSGDERLHTHVFPLKVDKTLVRLAMQRHTEVDGEFVQPLPVQRAIHQQRVYQFHLVGTRILIGTHDEVATRVFVHLADAAHPV